MRVSEKFEVLLIFFNTDVILMTLTILSLEFFFHSKNVEIIYLIWLSVTWISLCHGLCPPNHDIDRS